MTTAEMEGRVAALEIVALTALGLCLADVPGDADMAKARGLLDYLRTMVEGRAATMMPEAAQSARDCGDELLSVVLEDLRLLRTE